MMEPIGLVKNAVNSDNFDKTSLSEIDILGIYSLINIICFIVLF